MHRYGGWEKNDFARQLLREGKQACSVGALRHLKSFDFFFLFSKKRKRGINHEPMKNSKRSEHGSSVLLSWHKRTKKSRLRKLSCKCYVSRCWSASQAVRCWSFVFYSGSLSTLTSGMLPRANQCDLLPWFAAKASKVELWPWSF